MDEEIPLMLRFLFGEAAETARRGAGERLMRWCRAYEDWLGERKERYGEDTVKQSKMAWRRLLQKRLPGERQRLPGERQLMPWELREADIEGHARWMQAEGYSPATISCALGIIANFYRWCNERQIDAECEAGFNPAEKVRRPKVGRYREAKLLSQGELRRLLRTMRADTSALGRRDYAFTLARVRLGVPLRSLQELKWGQIEQEAEWAWVRWRARAERVRLPGEVWEAIQAALEAGGRLRGMREGDYVFAPLRDPLKMEVGSRAEDWAAGRPLSTSELLLNLKLYGRLAGVPEEKLTLMALRRTAMRLRLDEGAEVGEMKAFLDSQEEAKSTKYRLGKLPQLPGESGRPEEGEVRVPVRQGKPFQPGEGIIHGLYARSKPPEAVAAVIKENIQGMGEEIVGLRILGRGMLERQGEAESDQEAARLGEAYSLTALRLGEIIKAEKELAKSRESGQWAENLLEGIDRFLIERGEEPMGDKMRAEAMGLEPELEAGTRRLVEEIASMRYCLRNAFRLAIEAEETREQIHYAEIYSSGCVREAKLLRMERSEASRLEVYVKEEIDQAIREVNKAWGR